MVFHYTDEAHANYFDELLTKKGIWFERDKDEDGEVIRYLFAVKKADRKGAISCNFLVKGKFRQKFIPNKWMRFSLLLLVLILMCMVIIGIVKT